MRSSRSWQACFKVSVAVSAVTWGLVLGSASIVLADVDSEISHLLAFIERSKCTFYRNGRSYPAPEARAHIERKYQSVRDRVKSTEDFIDLSASRSSLTGQPYLVSCANREQTPSSDWLKDELIVYRQNLPR